MVDASLIHALYIHLLPVLLFVTPTTCPIVTPLGARLTLDATRKSISILATILDRY